MTGTPEAEVSITEHLVQELLDQQHRDLSDLPLSLLGSGWDNVMYRLGDSMLVRLPRREVSVQLLLNEQSWLPTFPDLLIPIPTPIRLGTPSAIYPWPWSVVPMFEGECVDRVPPASSEVERFAGFLAKLHQFAPQQAPQNSVRGVPLHLRQVPVEERMLRLKHKTDLISDKISHIWSRGLAAVESTECRWLHGDLHAQNVLVNEAGLFSAVIDWGDITSGDVATDLASTWSMFDQSVDRMRLLELYNPDQATLERARAWAVLFGVVLADSGLINSPRHAAQGQAILLRLSEDG